MNGLLVLALFGISTNLSIAQEYQTNFSTPPGRAIGRLVSASGEICTAFLSGPRQITTTARCAGAGPEGLRFELHYAGGQRVAVPKFTNIYFTGGGIDTEGQLRGYDWAHLEIQEPLGDTYGHLELWPGELSVGTPLVLNAYTKGWYEGRYSRTSQCEVAELPERAKRSCRRVDGRAICPFFTHTCNLDSEGRDAGAPLIAEFGGKPYVVGLVVGPTRVGGVTIAERVHTPGTTDSERASEMFSHWLALDSFTRLRAAAAYVRGAQAPALDVKPTQLEPVQATYNYAGKLLEVAAGSKEGFPENKVLKGILNVKSASAQWSLNAALRAMTNQIFTKRSAALSLDLSQVTNPESYRWQTWSTRLDWEGVHFSETYWRFYSQGTPVRRDASPPYTWAMKEAEDRRIREEEARQRRQAQLQLQEEQRLAQQRLAREQQREYDRQLAETRRQLAAQQRSATLSQYGLTERNAQALGRVVRGEQLSDLDRLEALQGILRVYQSQTRTQPQSYYLNPSMRIFVQPQISVTPAYVTPTYVTPSYILVR